MKDWPQARNEQVFALGDWAAGSRPLYRSLAEALRSAIERGQVRPGTQLLPERELARSLAVSRTTIVAAYDILRQDCLVASRRGSGTFVLPTSNAISDGEPAVVHNPVYSRPVEQATGVIEFTVAAPPRSVVPTHVIEAAIQNFDRLEAGHGYLPYGLPELRREIANYLSRDGLPTQEGQVLVTSGAQQAISLCSMLFLRHGDNVIVEDPTWIGAIDAFRGQKANIIGVQTDADGIRTDGARELIANRLPRLVYVCPTFHNPTGVQTSHHRRRELAAILDEFRTPVIEDNTLAELPLTGRASLRPLAAYAKLAPVLTVGSLSKVYWGGLRVGWIRGPEAIIARLAQLKAVTDHGTSVYSQAIAAHLVANIRSGRELRRDEARRRLEVLTRALQEHLPSWKWQEPAGGLSLWVQVPAGSTVDFAQVAQRHGVTVVAGQLASPEEHYTDYLRIPFIHPHEVLELGVRRLAQAWHTYLGILSLGDPPRMVVG